MAERTGKKRKGKEPPAPRTRPEWSRVMETRRAWMAGGSPASLGFLADQGLRLLMADLGRKGEVTLHFHVPRDGETVHLKAPEGEGLLDACAKCFPAAARRVELLAGGGRKAPEPDAGALFLTRDGLLLEVRGGRIRRVHEAAREHPGAALYGSRARQAVAVLAQQGGWEGTARAVAFACALEDARGMKAPLAALALRAALCEVSNACAHLDWVRGLAALLGRPGVAARCQGLIDGLREGAEEWLGALPAGRWIVPGGVGEDFPREGAAAMAERLAGAAALLHDLSRRALALPVPGWAERRSRGLGDMAARSGWVGPLARAAGLEADTRREEPGVYAALGYRASGASKGGGMLRRMLRLRVGEARFSLQAAADMLGDLPEGPLLAKRGRGGRGEGFGRCEGPDGEVCCHVVLDRGQVSRLAFSLPRELNRSAARCLEGAWLDEEPILSSLWWGYPVTGAAGTGASTGPRQLSLLP